MDIITWAKQSSLTRYGAIGFSAFIIDYGLLSLGLRIALPLLLANGLSVTFSIIYSFFMHRYITFAHHAKVQGYKINAKKQFIVFVIVSTTALLLSELFVSLLVHKAGTTAGQAKALSSAALFVWNYCFNRLLTFR